MEAERRKRVTLGPNPTANLVDGARVSHLAWRIIRTRWSIPDGIVLKTGWAQNLLLSLEPPLTGEAPLISPGRLQPQSTSVFPPNPVK